MSGIPRDQCDGSHYERDEQDRIARLNAEAAEAKGAECGKPPRGTMQGEHYRHREDDDGRVGLG